MAQDELPFAHGGPPLSGVMRSVPEDFVVDEDLGFAPNGAGEHAFVRVEKRGANTEWVARELARFAGVTPAEVSYAGLKDRHAVARQTFSLHLPGKNEPAWSSLENPEFRVLHAVRHSRKLKRGALKGNRFEITLRDVVGDRAAAEKIIERIRMQGVPNYFGEQRFGRGHANIERALAMFAGRRVQRHERSMLISAARSHLFNSVVAERVERGDWNVPLEGDVWMLEGTQSIFGPEPVSAEIAARCAQGDIAPTGPMWGAGELRSQADVARIERDVAEAQPALAAGLATQGLRQERRSLVLRAHELETVWVSDAVLRVSFYLRSGAYATVLMRELSNSHSTIAAG